MPDRSTDNRREAQHVADLLADLAAMRPVGMHGDERENGSLLTFTTSATGTVDNRTVAAYEAALAIVAEDTLPAMLRRLVDSAREVVGAAYGALVFAMPDSDNATVLLSGTAPDASMNGAWMSGESLVKGATMPDAPILATPGKSVQVRSMVGMPLRTGDRQAGYLFQADKVGGGAFDEVDLGALALLARHATAAMTRAQTERGLAMGQHRIEAQLSQLRTIMDTLPAGILVLMPPDGRVELANETALLTILGEEREGSTSMEVYRDFFWHRADGTELPRSHHPGMRALKGETIGNRALTLRTKDGTHVPVRVQSTPIYGPSGAITRAVVLFLDVSRERAAEQVKDDFLSLISHEFRTPLTAIHGGALLLSQQGEHMDAETYRELLQDIGEESLRLDRMLGNLLSVSEIMAGRFQAVTEPILVAPLVQPLIDEFGKRAQNHTFSLDVEPGVPPAEGTPELLTQILRNLYENAVKYSPGSGHIRTVIRRQEPFVSIEVIDSGLGIAAEHVPHVFERFRRPGAEPTVRGMGLGLYLSRLLVDAQGGRIRASSPGPGKGATFIVQLPVVQDWEHYHEYEMEHGHESDYGIEAE